MRSLRMSALVGLLVLTACQADRQVTEPNEPGGASLNSSTTACPSAAKLLVQIVTIVKPGQGRLATAIIKFDQIILALLKHDTAKAQKRMFELLDFLVQEYNSGNLIGGKSTATQTKLTTLTSGLYCLVGLTPPTIPAGALGPGGGIGVVSPTTTTTLLNTNNQAGVQVPPSTSALVTISPRSNAPPLLTPLDQYPAFYDFNVSPEGPFASDVIIGVCVGNAAPLAIFDRLKIAHNVGTGVEILDRITLPFALNCGPLGLRMGSGEAGLFALALRGLGTMQELLLPEMAHATAVGQCCVGGTTKKFSPFGAVDPVVFATSASPPKVYGLPNGSVPLPDLPKVRVRTLNGNPVPGLTVTFTVVGEGTISPLSRLTNSSGEATLDSWTLGSTVRVDSVVATITPILGTTVDGSPRVFEAEVINQIQIPFGAAGYSYKLIGNGSPPTGWEKESPLPAGFSAGTSPFGSPSSCDLSAVTPWPPVPVAHAAGAPGDNSDLLARHSFLVPNGWSGTVKITSAIDNDIQVFVNDSNITTTGGGTITGGFRIHDGCATYTGTDFTVPNGLLHRGAANLIAVRARDRGVDSYLDIKLKLEP